MGWRTGRVHWPSSGVYLAYSDDGFLNALGPHFLSLAAPVQNTTSNVVHDPLFPEQVGIDATGSYLVEAHVEITGSTAGTVTFSIVDGDGTSYDSDSQSAAGPMIFDLEATIPVSTLPFTIHIEYTTPSGSDYSAENEASYIRVTE